MATDDAGQERRESAAAPSGARTFFVRIDLGRLRMNLARAEQREWSEAEVKRWLDEAGFRPQGDGWIVSEADLGQLLPREVLWAEVAPRDPPGAAG